MDLALLAAFFILAKQAEEEDYSTSEEEDSFESEVEMEKEPGPSTKRRIENVDDGHAAVDSPVPAKRNRMAYDPFDEIALPAEPDPACGLPPASDTFIQLRFQLCRFKGVYRIARLPLSFTFAHLYKFILLIFGWSGHHLHQASVVTHAQLYSANWRRGEIKKHRSIRVPEQPHRDDVEEYREWVCTYAKFSHDPTLKVTPGGLRRPRPPPDPNDDWDVFFSKMQVPVKKDAEVTLGDVWAAKSRNNVSKGACSNLEIGIMFEYDLSSSWDVHITVAPEKNGEYMWKTDVPRNYPIVTVAKGGPPVEDAHNDYGEIEGKNKSVSGLIFMTDTFEKFLKGEIGSVARKTEHAIYKVEEEQARLQALAQQKEQRRLARLQKRARNGTDEDEDEVEDSSESSEDDY